MTDTKLLLDEGFLARRSRSIRVDTTLPLRLQKRQLLRALGFPTDSHAKTIRASDIEALRELLLTGFRDAPFLIVTSPSKLETVVPPLFIVEGEDDIIYRDQYNLRRKITKEAVLEVISSYAPNSWVEFVKPLWGERTIAGRLLYIDAHRQTIELQKGVDPAHIGHSRIPPYFSGECNTFECHRYAYIERARSLRRAGYPAIVSLINVQEMGDTMRLYADKFETLAAIAALPTLEFAWLADGRFIVVDIDWPAQWIVPEEAKE